MNNKPIRKNSIFNLLKKIKKINIGSEKISLDQSVGRFLNEELISKINLPPFNNSAVDGYALFKNDILNKKNILSCNHRIAAGENKKFNLMEGEVARIFTGAKMPKNSKTVIMQENVNVFNNNIKIKKMPKFGENCRLAGEDITKGQKIFSIGNKISSHNINLIAAVGKKNILVKKKISIGFYTSGNELTEPSEHLKGTSINNSNYYSLRSLLNKPYIRGKYLEF